jgi:hypothetical protein
MCSGVDSVSKNEYQDTPGGKDGRCVRVTTLPLSCAECLEILDLNLPETPKATRPVVGLLYLYLRCDSVNHLHPVCQDTRGPRCTCSTILGRLIYSYFNGALEVIQ